MLCQAYTCTVSHILYYTINLSHHIKKLKITGDTIKFTIIKNVLHLHHNNKYEIRMYNLSTVSLKILIFILDKCV